MITLLQKLSLVLFSISLFILMEPVTANKDPVNSWIPTSERQGGFISGTVYLPEQKGILYFGSPHPKYKGSDLELYLPGKKIWEEQLTGHGPHRQRGALTTIFDLKDRPGLPTINRPYWMAHQFCYLPSLKKVLYFAGGATFTYDPAQKKWEHLNIPLNQSPPDVMLGSMAWDPVNKRAILFGGGYISAHKFAPGYIKGNQLKGLPWTPEQWTAEEKRSTWAFYPQEKKWRKIVTGSGGFRKLFHDTKALEPKLDTLVGAVRGIALEYGDKVRNKSPTELVVEIDKLIHESMLIVKSLASASDCQQGYEKERCKAAADEINIAITQLKKSSSELKIEDGWSALRSLEKVRWLLFEAAEIVAPSPMPRYYGNLTTDTKTNLLVLFGGHGGNKELADTWVFDPLNNQWRQSQSKIHPPFTARPAMSFDTNQGVIFLATGWTYDSGTDEWKKVSIKTPDNYFLPWTTLEYDPNQQIHVAVSTNSNLFNPQPRRTAHLRLNIKSTITTSESGSTWRWLNNKYTEAWKKLPKNQSEYKTHLTQQNKFLVNLRTNTWNKLTAPYNSQNRAYGSFMLDWDRDQLINWGGGHSAYMGNEFSHYDIKSNLWMESWAPDMPPWPFGSPDGDGWNPALYHRKGAAHGYHYYVYNSDLKKVLFRGGTDIYDPNRQRWVSEKINKWGKGRAGLAVDMSGTKGFYTVSPQHWYGKPHGIWYGDAKAMTLTQISRSITPFSSNDRAKPVFDSKRNRILFYKGGVNTDDQLYAFNLGNNTWEMLKPTIEPPETEPPVSLGWGIAYSPKQDILIILPGSSKEGTWIYDCDKNILRKFGPAPETKRWGTSGVIYSAFHDVFIALETGSYGVGPVALHYMRIKK